MHDRAKTKTWVLPVVVVVLLSIGVGAALGSFFIGGTLGVVLGVGVATVCDATVILSVLSSGGWIDNE